MSENQQFARPIDVYKAIIDQLVTETSHSIHERLVIEAGIWSNSPHEGAANEFIRSLSTEQRRMMARMLHDERTSAIHDVLALLTWWITTRGVSLAFRGQPMPIELSGEGLNGDYIGRDFELGLLFAAFGEDCPLLGSMPNLRLFGSLPNTR